MTPKIFGREPAFWTGTIEALLAMLVSFGALGFIGLDDANSVAVVMAVVVTASGTYVAYVTKDTLLGVGIAFIKAVLALVAYYGYDFSAEQIGTVVALASLLLGAYQRTQTGPAVVPSLNLGQHSVEVPPEGEATKTVPALTTNNVIVERSVAPDLDKVPADVQDQIEKDGRQPTSETP